VKKIYFTPERIKIPGYKNKQNFDLIKIFGDSSLYFLNGKEILITGKIMENSNINNNKILRNNLIRLYENENGNEYNKNDQELNNIININNNENENEENFLKNFNNNLLNKFNFLFILNTKGALIFYEKIFGLNKDNINNNNLNNSISIDNLNPLNDNNLIKKESFLRSSSKKILTIEEKEKINLLSFRYIKLFEENVNNNNLNYEDYNNDLNENENENEDEIVNIKNNLKSLDESYEIIDKDNYNNDKININSDEKIQYLYDSNNIKLKLSHNNYNYKNNYNYNDSNYNSDNDLNLSKNNYFSNKNLNFENFILNDDYNNINNNEDNNNYNNYNNYNNFNNKIENINGSFSQDNLFGKELFTDHTENNEIFVNNFSFEQTVEELRSYINLVGISLIE
jgi:hypothetical protein